MRFGRILMIGGAAALTTWLINRELTPEKKTTRQFKRQAKEVGKAAMRAVLDMPPFSH